MFRNVYLYNIRKDVHAALSEITVINNIERKAMDLSKYDYFYVNGSSFTEGCGLESADKKERCVHPFYKELYGVEWKDKEYEGSRFDGMPHQMKYKVTNFKL